MCDATFVIFSNSRATQTVMHKKSNNLWNYITLTWWLVQKQFMINTMT